MYPTVVFLPWIALNEPLAIGDLRLLPYERRLKTTADLPHVAKRDLDLVMSAYSDSTGRLVQRATLVEFGDWQCGQNERSEVFSRLRTAREILAFSALADRRLFAESVQYVNSDNYLMVAQRFQPGQPGFAFNARRRDGGSSNFWTSDHYAFQRPMHVPASSTLSLDMPLAMSLMQLAPDDRLLSAIREFNAANTDSRDLPLHVEMVMCSSALEWLTGDHKAKGLQEALAAWLPKDRARIGEGPMKQAWLDRWNPPHGRLILAWARDFQALRGMSAHAGGRGATVWNESSHLAFIALLFPVLVKIVLATRLGHALSERDQDEADMIENYLLHDPFQGDYERGRHPWHLARNRLSDLSLRRGIAAAFKEHRLTARGDES